MPSLLDSLEDLFFTRDLYDALGVEGDCKKATPSQIKKAYHKSSLRHHPDRVDPKDRDVATKKFQALGATYKILSDPDAKALYDECGEVDEENAGVDFSDNNKDWNAYWRSLFHKVTLSDIKKFESGYRNSKKEDEDLMQAYCDGEGSIDFIIDNVLCSTHDDEDRFIKKIQGWIEEGLVPKFPQFKKDVSKSSVSKRKKSARFEAKEAEEYAKELGLAQDDMGVLQNAILKRQEKRAAESESFLDALAAKYAKPEKKKATKKTKQLKMKK